MPSDIFSVALDAIRKANDYLEVSENTADLPEVTPFRKHVSDERKENAMKERNEGRPESISDAEKKQEERKKCEAVKENERSKEINLFQKGIDEASVMIDLKLRKMLSIQAEDLAEDFGLVRNNVEESSSEGMKALADRQMREQALLSLQNLTTRFTNKRIYDELEGTSAWLDAQQHNHVKTFEKLGVAVSELDGLGPESQREDHAVEALLDSSAALLQEGGEPGHTESSNMSRIALLSSKLKETQDRWRQESEVAVEALEAEMVERAAELRSCLRRAEDGLTALRKRGSELDKQLAGTKEGQMREAIHSQVKDIERRYEYHIERQQKQVADITAQIDSQKLVNEAMQRSVEENMPPSGEVGESDFELDEHLSGLQEEVLRLKGLVDLSTEDLKTLKGRADDGKDEVNSLQSKAREIKKEMGSCTSRQKGLVRAAQSQLALLAQQKLAAQEEVERLHDRVMALGIAQSRRQNATLHGTGGLDLSGEDGQNFLMKARLSNADGVTQITAARVLQKRKANQVAPGHTRLWPSPHSNNKADLIHFVEEESEGADEEDDPEAEGDSLDHEPAAISHVCEAAYRHFALKLMAKECKSKGKGKLGKKKKGKEAKSAEPSYSHKEATSVCEAILAELSTLKHLDKAFLSEKRSELSALSREVPIMQPEKAEQVLSHEVCIPLIAHITSHHINSIVAENKMYTMRIIIVSCFAFLGVLFSCLPHTVDSFTSGLTPHPGFIKHVEDVSFVVLKKLLTGSTKQAADKSRPVSRASKEKKGKSSKAKAPPEVDDPLHPRAVYRCLESSLFRKLAPLRRMGLSNQLEVVREWVQSASSREGGQAMHADWATTSSRGAACQGKGNTIFSEDRFGLCAYQVR